MPKLYKNYTCKICAKDYTHWHYASRFCSNTCSNQDKYIRNKARVLDKNYQLNAVYGISLETFNNLLTSQKEVCKICRKPENLVDKRTGKMFPLCVDHCHDTNRIRGLLCRKCNMVLGLVNDRTDLLENMIKYINTSDTELKKTKGV